MCVFLAKDLNTRSHRASVKTENTLDVAPIHTLSGYFTINGWLLFSIINGTHAYCRKFGEYRQRSRRNINQRELPHFGGHHWQHFGLFPVRVPQILSETLCQARCWTPHSLSELTDGEREGPLPGVVTWDHIGKAPDLGALPQTLGIAEGLQRKRCLRRDLKHQGRLCMTEGAALGGGVSGLGV